MFLPLIIAVRKKKKFKEHKQYRLPTWDYSENGYYFVTICTKNRKFYFGNLINTKLLLSKIGKITKEEWLKTSIIRKNVALDRWVIMPNHIHGILIINRDYTELDRTDCGRHITRRRHIARYVSTDKLGSRFGKIKPKSLSSIIRSFKSAVTKRCNENNLKFFAWQARFYDHIIRNEKDLYNIREYIINNPLNWELDRNYPENMDFL